MVMGGYICNQADCREYPVSQPHVEGLGLKCLLGLLVLLGALYGSKVWAGVSIYPKQVMLGEPITLVMSGKDIEADFEKIDKNRIREFFEIYDVDGYSDRIRLTLYPRRAGNIQFPALSQGAIRFSGQTIEVKENDRVHIQWTRPDRKGWVQHYRAWLAHVSLSESADRAELQLHPHARPEVEKQWQPSPVTIQSGFLERSETFLMAVSSAEGGTVQVRSPMIVVRHSGPRPWRFFDQTLSLDFQRLPSFLPAFFPVGTLNIASYFSDRFIATGSLQLWTLEMTGKNVLSSNFPDVTATLKGKDNLIWLSSEKTVSQHMTPDGVVSLVRWEQPFRMTRSGIYSLPPITVTYFDPETGKLADKTLPSHWVGVFPAVFIYGVYILIGIVITVLVLLLGQGARQALGKWQLKQQIARAQTAADVWQAVLKWSSLYGLNKPSNVSHGQWLQWIQEDFRVNVRLFIAARTLVMTLDQCEFSHNKDKAHQAQAWKLSAKSFVDSAPSVRLDRALRISLR